jgi:hypothetical protein
MAVINYEPLGARDRTTTTTSLYESIPLTGSIISGTYGGDTVTLGSEPNIKNYTHGQFQSVYDYPYLSSSANHIFDITMGYNASSPLSASAGGTPAQEAKKINMYNQISQVLLGYTSSANTTRDFELDLTLDQTGSMKECFFLNFSRLIYKDQIKKGSFSITLGTSSWSDPMSQISVLTDASASSTQGTANTLGGDYGVLYTSGNVAQGVVFYQAGIVALSTASFVGPSNLDFNSGSILSGSGPTKLTIANSFVSASISGNCNAARHRIKNISFNNTTEINSTIYFCRIPHNKYNYSANPTYLSSSQIVVKNIASDTPVSYITTIGLYSSNNELLATAKLSEPLRKDPNNEITLRVRLDY